MANLKHGGPSALASDLTASPLPKPDISLAHQLPSESESGSKETQLRPGEPSPIIDNSVFGSLPIEEARMLTADELTALRASLRQIADYAASKRREHCGSE